MPTPTNRIVENKPTAGPWRVEDVGIPGTLAIMAGSTTEYRWIATVTEDMGSGVDWTQTQANAQLMVASHDLLDALIALKEVVDIIASEECDEGTRVEWWNRRTGAGWQAAVQADATIARATGEKP